MQGGRTWWERDEMRREGACEVGGNWDATWEASRQPSVGDANINNQITRSRRIREVVDDFEVPALQARALGDSLRLDLVSSSLEERAELTNHPIVRLGST